jgi:hypothetical protein
VCDSLRERIDFHPALRILFQIPKHVSKIIATTAIRTKGTIGVSTVQIEKARIVRFDFIKTEMELVSICTQ